MRTVGLKVLKNKLSEYVRLASGGETVLVTDRDRVVAELRPPESEHGLPEDGRLAQLAREGVLAPAANRTGKPPRRRPKVPFARLMRDLARDRADREG